MKNFCLYLLIVITMNVNAQNLVPNPSFEDTIHCPDFPQPTINYCQDWTSYGATSDYYNICAGSTSYWNVPNNLVGYEFPKHGNGYSGLITWGISPNTREFEGVKLISPLIIGVKYYLSLYVSNADSATILCNCNSSSNNIGIKFTNIEYSETNFPPIDNSSHLHASNIISEKTSWTFIKGSFVADSSYQYLAIGNFYDDAHTLVDTAEPVSLTYAYYYVDAVCVTTDSLLNETWISVNDLTNKNNVIVYPNPASNLLAINYPFISSIEIINITGLTILKHELYAGSNLFDISSFAAGVYFIRFENNSYFKLLVQH